MKKGDEMRKSMFSYSILLSAMILFATVGISVAEEPFVNIPGGLKKADINRLMMDAKMKCFDLGYKIVNEDKDSGYLIAEQSVKNAKWTMIIQINEKGFVVKHNSNDIGSNFNPYFKKWRNDVHNTLLKSAGKKS
jgi:hypothetical protein